MPGSSDSCSQFSGEGDGNDSEPANIAGEIAAVNGMHGLKGLPF
jgi:hypothetical protein